MRGHITKRGKGSYSIVVELGRDPATGKRKQQWVSVKGTKKDAEKRLAELLWQIDNGTYMKPGKTTVAEYLARWLKDYVLPNLSPRTAEGYESIIDKHLIPAFGKMVLTQLKPEHIQRYYSEKLESGRIDGKGGLNPQTVRHHHMALHCALEIAVKWGLIAKNPADAVNPPKAKRKEINTMSEQEVSIFLNAAKETPYYELFYLAIFTGMRRSELLALKWSDVDLEQGQLSINRTIHQAKDNSLVFRHPKTEKGRRQLALTPSSVNVLTILKNERSIKSLLSGTTLKDEEFVFCNIDSKPLLPDTVTQAWSRLVKKVGLEHIRFHDARHTHASLMLRQGVHPKIVQERLGHASIQITLDTYSHITPGLQAAAALKFDKCFTLI